MPWIIGVATVVGIIILSVMIDASKNKAKRALVENWVDEAFKDSRFIPEERITVKEIKEELRTVDKTIIEAMTKYVKCMDKLSCKEVAYVTDNQKYMQK